MKILLFYFILFFNTYSLLAQITLPAVISDNMVLQRESEVKMWGWATRASKISIIPSWSKDTINVKVTGYAKFETNLQTPQAGGPYSITFINGKYKRVINNILIGEVWLASGQSNMEWSSLNKLQEMLDELPHINNNQIRFLHVNRQSSYTPQDNFTNTWQEANSLNAVGFSAIGYFYAKKLQQELGVPIGIISANWGGTTAEVWVPDTLISNNPLLATDAKRNGPSPIRPHEAGTLWNSMIHPLVGYNLAGVIWYQGESNVRNYANYHLLMKKLLATWRGAWKQEFPFYTVQIAPYNYKSKPEKQLGALLREQQVAFLQQPKTGMVVVTDLVEDVNDIHPQKKREVAYRLANLALAETYGFSLKDYKSPIYKSYEIKQGKIIVTFDFVENGLEVKGGKDIVDLYVADASQKFIPAQYQINGNKLVVYHPTIKNPIAVRFAFKDTSISNLFTKSGLPVSPFRTDNWNL